MFIRLTEQLPSFRVSHESVTSTYTSCHFRRNLTRERSTILPVNILDTKLNSWISVLALISSYKRNGRRKNQDLIISDYFINFKGTKKGTSLFRSHMHFPVSCDNRHAYSLSLKESTPGNVFPAKKANEAPSPLET